MQSYWTKGTPGPVNQSDILLNNLLTYICLCMSVLLTCFLIAGCLMSSNTLCASLSSRAVNQRLKVNSNMCNRTKISHWVVVLSLKKCG